MSYHTAITITTTPVKPPSPDALSPISPKGRKPRVQLVEERRTYYVTSEVPASQWEHDDLANALKLPELSTGDADRGNGSPFQRSKSQNEVHVPTATTPVSPSPPRPRSIQDMPICPTSRYRSRRLTLLKPISNAQTPPNTPITVPRPKVLFYHKHNPHYGFTNFSPHPVFYQGKRYPTSEHLFQSFKFEHKPALVEHIRAFSERPSDAFSEARRLQSEVRSDWRDVNIEKMDIALQLKFTQHPDLKQELLTTGNAELVEDSDKDAFWGIGHDGSGRNELGKALERLRSQLRGH
ncbi:hypothetical protein E1B28_010991 [Marasmius oreades]|uniref:NADAR domain-containing protein n=1 Tax=Marasmius oreades TaxID=181124 RepID=A0A9P7RUI6_9AGAR|nr:uncharacterized protein E1B28_010991 [Marasmius oreades]KAG7089293.1 hypothetical protein E1B28_010991 [Marasmius oreades]